MKPFLIVVGILLLAAVLAACVRKPAVQIEPAAYDAAVQRQIAEDSLSFLQSRIGDDATFSAIADAFDALCAEPTADEEILFEAGTYKLIREPIGEPRFSVSLARQIPNGEDEFFQIRAELLFLPDADNAQIEELLWLDPTDADALSAVRQSAAFAYANTHTAVSVDVFIDET